MKSNILGNSLNTISIILIAIAVILTTNRCKRIEDRIIVLELAKKATQTIAQPTTKPKVVYADVETDPISSVYPVARKALNLLRQHESRNNANAIGDGGKAHGWLQQHKGHWDRGCEMLKVKWPYPESTTNLERCERIALANWQRDARQYLQTGNVNELIRRFRLPFAPYRKSNDEYLAKVLKGNPDG